MGIPRRRPFSNLWYKVYRQIIRKGHCLSGLPFSVTNDTHLLSIPPGSDRRFKFFMVYFTFYNLIYVLNYIYVIIWGTEDDYRNQAFCICLTFVLLVVWCLMLPICVKSHQMGSMINSVIEFAGTFNGMSYFLLHKGSGLFNLPDKPYLIPSARWRPKFNPNMDNVHRYLSIIVAALVPLSILSSTLNTILFIIYPESNIYLLLMWMPAWLRNNSLTIALYGCLWLWMQMACWTAIVFILTIILSYFVLTYPLVCHELVRGRRSYNTNCRLRLTNNLRLEYRKFEVLHLNAMDVMGWVILPEQALLADAIMFCNYALITVGHELGGLTTTVLVIFAVVLMTGWVTILEACGIFHKQSETLIESFKYGNDHGWNRKEKLYMDKFRKSCRPLGFRSGGGFCIKRLTGLKFIQGIVVGTLRILLST
jgi:hypothetical protein